MNQLTKAQAHAKARRLSRKNPGREYFVVREDGYDVCTECDLETFYMGIEPEACYFEDNF